jgi:uncharacterized protein YjbI with pentapeptide repeats
MASYIACNNSDFRRVLIFGKVIWLKNCLRFAMAHSFIPQGFTADPNNEDIRRLLSMSPPTESRSAYNSFIRTLSLCKRDLSNISFFPHDLSGLDFSYSNLAFSSMGHLKLRGAFFNKADLRNVDLSNSDLSRANLFNAKLTGSLLNETNLEGANLHYAELIDVDLSGACLVNANLEEANIIDTNLNRANIREANVSGIIWDRGRMRGRYSGIRGCDACYGNALFKRDAQDQDFLDTLEAKLRSEGRSYLFSLWGLIDYGRSLSLVGIYILNVIMMFGICYSLFPSLTTHAAVKESWFSPFYFSIVTFTTLGFGDISASGTIGQILVCAEVCIGYLMLGVLISVFADKVARRS